MYNINKTPEDKQDLQNNMQMNVNSLQALQQNLRVAQIQKNQEQEKVKIDINLMNRGQNNV